MKKILLFVLPLFLSGCAGMNSDFEFSKPAKDSGYWMQQADEMTNSDSGSPAVSAVNAGDSNKFNLRQYKLINVGNIQLPVKFVAQQPAGGYRPVQDSPVRSQSFAMNNRPAITPDGNRNDSVNRTVSGQTPVSRTTASSVCSQQRCYQEAAAPFVTPDKIQRVWIAPYVSPDNNVHIGEIVYFVSEDSHWFGME
ncbi:type IV conjugative transfer system lipoprotein TraV [Morganella morganii]